MSLCLTKDKYVQSHLIRLNGPKRACNISNLGEDLQLLRAVSAGNAMLSHGGRSSARKAADISAGLLEQLPNTISISFKGAKSYDLIALLSKKVRNKVQQSLKTIIDIYLLGCVFCGVGLPFCAYS